MSLLRYFSYEHLTGEKREVSKMFHDLACDISDILPESAETTVALRKLLEAKDAAVRSSLNLEES